MRSQTNKSWLLTLVLPTCSLASVSYAADVAWEGGITSVYQDSDDSRVEAELTASVDLFARIANSSGEWLIYVEGATSPNPDGVSAFYPTVNGDARSVLSQSGSGTVQVSEFNYTFSLDDSGSLMLGLIDPSAWLDRSRIANDENQHFLNGSFVNNATIEFPDYTLGGVYRLPATSGRLGMTVVVAGSDGILDTPDRSYQDLLDLTDQGRGVFAGFGANWLSGNTSWRAGAWVRSDDHVTAGEDTSTDINFGIYGVLGWKSGLHAVNFRAGLANPDVSIASGFAAVAYERVTSLGLFGVGAAHTSISPQFRTATTGGAWDLETFFRIPIFGGSGHITPSLQYVRNPGFDASGITVSSTAIVPGIRFHWSFER